MNNPYNYWFYIEPYVYVCNTNKHVLLYNTLDGSSMESNIPDIVSLVRKMFSKKHNSVLLLKEKQYNKSEIYDFIQEVRKKYLGDIINVRLSKRKPVLIAPYINYPNMHNKKCNFLLLEDLLQTLSEITIYINSIYEIKNVISFLQSIPNNIIYNIIIDYRKTINLNVFFHHFNQISSLKNIIYTYDNITLLEKTFKNNFSYKISVNFPIDTQLWNSSIQVLKNQDLPFIYIFNVTSSADCLEAEQLVKLYQIKKYHLNPIYTGNNIHFFEENIYLTKKDILSTSMKIRDFFIRQSINEHDFGKLSIMPNGDIFANTNYPALGNIYTHSIYDIIQKEINEGKSWLRTRTQSPCSCCVYQWLCPSPSDYEIKIGRPNLCHIK